MSTISESPLVERYGALVLAGRRGSSDPLAESVGASHRALVPVAGVAMLVRVVEMLRSVPSVGSVAVSIDRPDLVEAIPRLASLLRDGFLSLYPSSHSPAASVAEHLEHAAGVSRLLVTTADHPLLTRVAVEHFLRRIDDSGCEVAVAVVAESVFRRSYPDLPRTFVRLGGEAFSGANLFAFRGPHASRAARFWTRAERYRKRPWRLVGVFGARNLARFALGRLDVDVALAEASKRIGARVSLVRLPFAECAIDVDRPSDLALANSLLDAESRGATVAAGVPRP